MDNNALVERAQNGDKEAFSQLIKNVENELYKIARTRFYNQYDIEDVVQETIVQSLKSIKSLKYPQYFNTWIIRILINNCNIMYKKKGNTEFEEAQYSYIDNSEDINNKLNFDNIMKKLNYDERIAITLYYMEGYTNKEISKLLETKVGTIKSRISRAKQKIKEIYKEEIKNGQF